MSELQVNGMPTRSSAVNDATISLGDFVVLYSNILRRGWHLIAIALVCTLSIAAIYLISARRFYEATTRLLVLEQGGRPISVAGNDPNLQSNNTDDYLPTQALIIASPIVVRRAIDELGVEQCPSLVPIKREGLDVVAAAIDRLTVTRPDRFANFLNVSYRAYSPEEAVLILTAIIESYEKFLADSYQKSSTEAISLITKARDEVDADLVKLKEEYRKFREGNQTLLADDRGRSFASIHLEQLYRAVNEAKIKAANLKAEVEMAKKMADEGVSLWAISHAIEQFGAGTNQSLVANSMGLAQGGASFDYIRQLGAEQQKLMDEYGPQNTRVQEINQMIQNAKTGTKEVQRAMEHGDSKDLVTSLSMSLKAIERLEEELKKDFDESLKEAKLVELDLLLEADFKDRISRENTLFASVVDQLKQAEFVSEYTTIRSQAMEPPNAPPKAVSPKMGLTLAAAMVLGLFFGVLAAVGADHLDQRLRTFEEIRSSFHLPVLGVIPRFEREELSRISNPGLVAVEFPDSTWAESYRALRTNIEAIRRKHSTLQVFLITSPFSGDGKSTTSSNLATMIANTGKRVLLIDADLRRPSQQRIHDVSGDVGLSQILLRTATFDQARQRSSQENLSLLVAGSYELNPAELLASPEFSNLIRSLRSEYDTIILDTPPLLAVSDSAIVSAISDAIILVVGTVGVRKFDAEQSIETIASLGIPTLGIVINGASRGFFGGGYGYGYGYGANQRAGMPYAYGYGGDRRDEAQLPKDANGKKDATTKPVVAPDLLVDTVQRISVEPLDHHAVVDNLSVKEGSTTS